MTEPLDKNEKLSLPQWMSEPLVQLRELLNGLLAAASIFYVAGYIVWSFNAWENNLGLLPALDPQYFVAGFTPVVILVVALFLNKLLKLFFTEMWTKWVGEEATGFWRDIRLTLFLACGISLAFFLLVPWLAMILSLMCLGCLFLKRFAPKAWSRIVSRFSIEHRRTNRDGEPAGRVKVFVQLLLVAIATFLMFLWIRSDYWVDTLVFHEYAETIHNYLNLVLFACFILLPPLGGIWDWATKLYKIFWIYIAVFVFIVIGLVFYADRVYPNLPQEFGGVRPRCAFLDLKTEQVSRETRQALLPAAAMESDDPVARSVQVDALFSNKDLMLIRPYVEDQGNDPQTVYEIRKSNVLAVTWCDQGND